MCLGRRRPVAQASSVDEVGSAVDAVLFLRPAQGEQAPFSPADDRRGRLLSFERYVGPELTARVGPVVGLGAHEDVARLIPVVRCIVMLPQASQPLRDELTLIRDHHVVRKLFLVLGPYEELRARIPRWVDLVPVFAEHGLFLPTRHPGPGSVLGFRPDGRAVVRASGLDRGADYAAAIADGLGHDY